MRVFTKFSEKHFIFCCNPYNNAYIHAASIYTWRGTGFIMRKKWWWQVVVVSVCVIVAATGRLPVNADTVRDLEEEMSGRYYFLYALSTNRSGVTIGDNVFSREW